MFEKKSGVYYILHFVEKEKKTIIHRWNYEVRLNRNTCSFYIKRPKM